MYPWAGLGSFKFEHDERPARGSDSNWKRKPKRDRSANLGSARDTIRTLAVASQEREFTIYMEPSRFATLEGFIGLTVDFCDWTRPVPDARSVYVDNVEFDGEEGVVCSDNVERRKIRAHISLVSQ